MCCHLPRALLKAGDPGAVVGSRSDEDTGAFTRGSYRYLYPARAPAARTATVAVASHRVRERRLGPLVLSVLEGLEGLADLAVLAPRGWPADAAEAGPAGSSARPWPSSPSWYPWPFGSVSSSPANRSAGSCRGPV